MILRIKTRRNWIAEVPNRGPATHQPKGQLIIRVLAVDRKGIGEQSAGISYVGLGSLRIQNDGLGQTR